MQNWRGDSKGNFLGVLPSIEKDAEAFFESRSEKNPGFF